VSRRKEVCREFVAVNGCGRGGEEERSAGTVTDGSDISKLFRGSVERFWRAVGGVYWSYMSMAVRVARIRFFVGVSKALLRLLENEGSKLKADL
jgi:hypothetical protein